PPARGPPAPTDVAAARALRLRPSAAGSDRARVGGGGAGGRRPGLRPPRSRAGDRRRPDARHRRDPRHGGDLLDQQRRPSRFLFRDRIGDLRGTARLRGGGPPPGGFPAHRWTRDPPATPPPRPAPSPPP